MKKMKFYAFMMFAAIMAVSLTSCEEDEDGDAITITLSNVPTEGAVGTEFSVNYAVVLTDNNLEKIEFRVGPETEETVSTFANKTSHTGSFKFTPTEAKTYECLVLVTDTKGNTNQEKFSVVVKSAEGDINTFTAVLLGGQSNLNVGSFYASSTNKVYKVEDAKTNSALIDFIYYYGSANKATLAAPNDASVGGGTGNLDLAKDFATKNATKFAETTKTFESFETAALIKAETTSASLITDLAANKVYAFKTAGNKSGVLKVVKIDGTTGAGSITIEVKIEK